MRVLIFSFELHRKKLHVQEQQGHHHSGDPKGESKHEDMLEHQQGGDVGPQF